MRLDAPASVGRGDALNVVLRGTSNATPAKGLHGFAALLTYEASRVTFVSTDFVGTVFQDSEFQNVLDNGAGTIQVGVVHDQDGIAPPTPVVVPAGIDMAFLNITYTAGACPGVTTLGFTGTIDDNLLVDEDVVGHDTGNGLALTAAMPDITAAGTFVRGNAKNDAFDIANPPFSVDIADGIFLLQFLFLAGVAPGCGDAADANDDGRVNLVDSITIFQFLIGTLGPALADPFAAAGPDPTTDGLDCLTPPVSTGC